MYVAKFILNRERWALDGRYPLPCTVWHPAPYVFYNYRAKIPSEFHMHGQPVRAYQILPHCLRQSGRPDQMIPCCVAHVSVRGKTSCAKTRCWDWLGPSRKDGLRRRTTTNLSVIVISQIFAIGAYWDYVSSNISHTNESQRGSLLSGLQVR